MPESAKPNEALQGRSQGSQSRGVVKRMDGTSERGFSGRRRGRPPRRVDPAQPPELRHSDRAARLPTRRRRQIVRFAEFFNKLYADIGLTNEAVRNGVVLRLAAMYREDGRTETEANTAAEELAPGRAMVERLASPAQMLSQSDVGLWRVVDVLEACGSDLGTLAASLRLDATERERDTEQRRRAQAFLRLYNMLDALDQDYVRQDMQRTIERRQTEARMRSAGLAQLDEAGGLPSLPVNPPGSEERH